MTPQTMAPGKPVAQPSEMRLPKLNLRDHGLENVLAIPVDLVGMVDTLVKLGRKVREREQALQGLSKTFTIGGSTARAHAFLYGKASPGADAAAAYDGLRAALHRNPLAILPGLVDSIKAQEKELPRRAAAPDALTTTALDDPSQWSIGWTTFPDVYNLGLPHLKEWAATVDVTQPDKATEAFFPTIARYGRAYNLVL